MRDANHDTQAKIRPYKRHKSQFIPVFEYHLYKISNVRLIKKN